MLKLSMILIAISIIGALGLPIGDPRFLSIAVALEVAYIILAILSFKNIRYVPIASMILAFIVIVGNTNKIHLDIMLTLNPLMNAIILIVGGYVLQVLLIITSILEHRTRALMVR